MAELVKTVNQVWRREYKPLNIIYHLAIYLYQLNIFLWIRPYILVCSNDINSLDV
jgi:hypothetical protein